jgi:hypothetical protein
MNHPSLCPQHSMRRLIWQFRVANCKRLYTNLRDYFLLSVQHPRCCIKWLGEAKQTTGIDSETATCCWWLISSMYNVAPSAAVYCWRRAPRAHPGPISCSAFSRRREGVWVRPRSSSPRVLSSAFRVHLYFAGLARIGCKISGCGRRIRSAKSCKCQLRVQVAAKRAESTEFGLISSSKNLEFCAWLLIWILHQLKWRDFFAA